MKTNMITASALTLLVAALTVSAMASGLVHFEGKYKLVHGSSQCPQSVSIQVSGNTLQSSAPSEPEHGITLGTYQDGDNDQWTHFEASLEGSTVHYVDSWGEHCVAFNHGCFYRGKTDETLSIKADGTLTQIQETSDSSGNSNEMTCVYRKQ